MQYPLPFDAAGRTLLVFLGLAFLRTEGAYWLRGLVGWRVPRSLWLEVFARFGLHRVATRCSLALVRGAGRLALLIVMVLWSAYALARLIDDLSEAPALTVLGGSLGIMTCRRVCH
jgi:hypothetical protein